jgi:hypothetical protein
MKCFHVVRCKLISRKHFNPRITLQVDDVVHRGQTIDSPLPQFTSIVGHQVDLERGTEIKPMTTPRSILCSGWYIGGHKNIRNVCDMSTIQ